MKIIFHHPLPLEQHARSASGIRPIKMLEAFQEIGYQVEVISGYSTERKQAIRCVKEKIQQGTQYAFMYAESSTQPTTLTDKHHLPLHPWMDGGFFRFCRQKNIPIGLFYRDIYWRFDNYGKNLHPLKIAGAKAAYWFDLLIYKNTLTKLYLPSLEMGKYIPLANQKTFETLPPGHHQALPSTPSKKEEIIQSSLLRIFYVGGTSSHYKMHSLFDAVKDLPGVELTICTRKLEWDLVKHEYKTLTENIKIIHESGAKMENHLKNCDIASIFVEPQKYWEFAAPVKLYEYIGFHKPILASRGTLAGSFVENNKIGWTIDYNVNAVRDLLMQLARNKAQITDVKKSMESIAIQNSWQARARQVVEGLRRT